MNKEIRKLALEMDVLPSYEISREDKLQLQPEEYRVSSGGDHFYKYDDSITNEELSVILQLKNYKNIKTIKNIAVLVAVLVSVSVVVSFYYLSQIINVFTMY